MKEIKVVMWIRYGCKVRAKWSFGWGLMLALFLLGKNVHAQDEVRALADQYYAQEEYDKAAELYGKLARRQPQEVYSPYLNSLLATQATEDALNFVKKMSRGYPEKPQYQIDYALLLRETGSADKAKKLLEEFFVRLANNPARVEAAASYLKAKRELTLAEQLYLTAEIRSGNRYDVSLANVYAQTGRVGLMRDRLLDLLERDADQLDDVQNAMQGYLSEETQFAALDSAVLVRVQKKPSETQLNELLIWSFVQQKDFFSAFQQAKAVDRRQRKPGSKTLAVGKLALTNEAFDVAQEIFAYVVKQYPDSPQRPVARRLLIEAREAEVVRQYPPDPAQVREVIDDYRQFIDESRGQERYQSQLNVAILYASYLQSYDTATALLNELRQQPRIKPDFRSECKLALGDIYLLRGEPWESALLYAQVEKAEKDTRTGHEAKLRSAKLHYFQGDFELAQGHLDVLKLATSREIANDAMDLSILIQDNLALDTSTVALQQFARADLLLFQRQRAAALALLDSLFGQFPNHSLTDEVLWRRAQVYTQVGDYDRALTNLKELRQNHADNIYGDDAWFATADIYENHLRDREQALELYADILKRFPGSIFVAEARKRYRALRGDPVN